MIEGGELLGSLWKVSKNLQKVKLIRQHGKDLVHEVQKVHHEITEHLVMMCVSSRADTAALERWEKQIRNFHKYVECLKAGGAMLLEGAK